MNIDLSSKRAIVCGSTQGIGKAVAEELASLGASITLVARNEKKLKEVQANLPTNQGQEHHYVVADFSQPDYVKSAIQSYLDKIEEVHILLNNTGGPPAGKLYEADPSAFIQAAQMHVVCNHILVQAVLPKMKAAKYGRIINIVSTSVKEPIPGLGVSNTTRGAVASWAKTLSGELGPMGITVNNVLPGSTETDRIWALISNRAKEQGKTEKEIEENMKSQIPLRRFAQPSETAAAVAFLASPSAAYITGVSLPVDGGRINCL
ncbi:SDR family oxidoreductase [Catalinimonas sp. 4WD22]|uniref:SDR family oxidoreductase n=1 Tax=Catalinimonas locisalis TaxID=3133978 RepID=UPI0031015F57